MRGKKVKMRETKGRCLGQLLKQQVKVLPSLCRDIKEQAVRTTQQELGSISPECYLLHLLFKSHLSKKWEMQVILTQSGTAPAKPMLSCKCAHSPRLQASLTSQQGLGLCPLTLPHNCRFNWELISSWDQTRTHIPSLGKQASVFVSNLFLKSTYDEHSYSDYLH